MHVKTIMLDTSIINDIVSHPDFKRISRQLRGHTDDGTVEFRIIHIVEDELSQTPEKKRKRRKELLRICRKITVTTPSESFILGKSRLDMAKVGAGEGLRQILGASGPRQMNDALIVESASNSDYLVTSDPGQAKRGRKYLGDDRVIDNLDGLLKMLNT